MFRAHRRGIDVVLAVVAAGISILAAEPAGAQAQGGPGKKQAVAYSKIPVPGRWATSNAPYWQVGTVDGQLSTACQRRRFNQVQYLRLMIGYYGERGKGVTGIASKEWNLYDPLGLAKPDFTYHFFNDGFSDCRVYVAKTPKSGARRGRR
jgi:hypothetical protein